MLFHRNRKCPRFFLFVHLSFFPLFFIIVFLIVLMLMPTISNSQPPKISSVDTIGFYKNTNTKTDSVICELSTRLSKVESYLLSPLSDNLLHPKNVMAIASLIISAMAVIMVVVNIFLAINTRLTAKDWKEEYRNGIEDFKYAATLTKEELNETKDQADDLYKELEVLGGQAKSMTEIAVHEIEALFKAQNVKMMDTINSVIERFLEIFSDRQTSKRFEVIRSKAFFYLGDEREKIRSLQYIAFLGNSQDIAFLDKIIIDPQQSTDVKLAAQKAGTMILDREGKSKGT